MGLFYYFKIGCLLFFIFILKLLLFILSIIFKFNNSIISSSYVKFTQEYQNQVNNHYLNKSCLESELPNLKQFDKLNIFAIYFNDYSYLSELKSKLKTNDYLFWIIDNSNDSKVSLEIKKFCLSNKLNYIRLPENPYSGNLSIGIWSSIVNKLVSRKKYVGSFSHGIAINWVCKNIISKFPIQYFGFIDCDIIPINDITIFEILKTIPFYGRKQYVNGHKYLWPGYCFFNRNFVEPTELDFLPTLSADTGSMNSLGVFNRLDFEAVNDVSYEKKQILPGSDLQDHYIEFIDGWLHVVNSTNWKSSATFNEKQKIVKSILN